jgi:hypothetical protein
VSVYGQAKFAGVTGDRIRLENNLTAGVTLPAVPAVVESGVTFGATAATSAVSTTVVILPFTAAGGGRMIVAVQTTDVAAQVPNLSINDLQNTFGPPTQAFVQRIPSSLPASGATSAAWIQAGQALTTGGPNQVTVTAVGVPGTMLVEAIEVFGLGSPTGGIGTANVSSAPKITFSMQDAYAFASLVTNGITGVSATNGILLSSIADGPSNITGAEFAQNLNISNEIDAQLGGVSPWAFVGFQLVPSVTGFPVCTLPVNASLDVKLLI